MKPITSDADIGSGLTALLKLDTRLIPLAEASGTLPLRRRAADFEGLVQIVTGQQVSTASAAAIFKRLQKLVSPLTPSEIALHSDDALAGAGLSKPKIRTIRAITAACGNGLDLQELARFPAADAHAALCDIKGIGRWTADIFLLFCAGHPDIFPSGDLALQIAARDAFNLSDKPTVKELDAIADGWKPHRAVAARLLWAWYRIQKQGGETLPV